MSRSIKITLMASLWMMVCSSCCCTRDACCAHCGCQTGLTKVCQVTCEMKKFPKTVYSTECEDFCVPNLVKNVNRPAGNALSTGPPAVKFIRERNSSKPPLMLRSRNTPGRWSRCAPIVPNKSEVPVHPLRPVIIKTANQLSLRAIR